MPILEREPSVFPCNLLTDAAVISTEDPNLETDRQWWVIYTRSRQEKALARQLYNFQIPFYLPLVPMCHLYQGRKMSSYLPLFQGYVFLFGTEDERLMSLTTKRISCILPVKNPSRLCQDLFNVSRLIETNAAVTIEERLQPGERVRIKSGAMKGLEGTIIERRGGRRLLIVIDYIQQGISVAIEDFKVEAA